jgi:uncharacterized protein YcfL
MRKRYLVVLLLCVSILLPGCNSVEESTNISVSSSNTTDTTSIEESETPSDSSLTTTETTTETSITYESYAIP